MNLPVVLDVAIGLVFIYLIASLLASEIQELISTLLQWRAKHLRESIENLLSGGQGTDESIKVLSFVESLYDDPLIKNMNQEAKGLIGQVGQKVYNTLYRNQRIFGKRASGPSYIAPETFAMALLDQLGMSLLLDKLTEARLEKFATRIIGLYKTENDTVRIPESNFFESKDNWEKGGIRLLAEKAQKLGQDQELQSSPNAVLSLDEHNEDFAALVEDYFDILRDFRTGEANLEISVDRMREGLDLYIHQVEEKIAVQNEISLVTNPTQSEPSFGDVTQLEELEKKRLDYFKQRLNSFKLNTFGEKNERAVLSGKLKPSLQEIAQVFDKTSSIYTEIMAAYREVAAAYEAGQTPEKIQPLLQSIATKVAEISAVERGAPLPVAPVKQPENLADLLTNEEYQLALTQVVESLPPSDREHFEGWKTYHQIILNVIRAIAEALQQEGRLFRVNQAVTRPVETLEITDLVRSVEESLDRVSDEERHLLINQALSQVSPESRELFRNYETYSELQKILQRVPNSVKQSLAILARRVQTKTTQSQEQIEQFNHEVSVWFDRSMSRASGVYKRNAKGVAILIGFLIAVLSNADTFHIVSRLADDEDLRNVISQRAASVTEQRQNAGVLKSREDLRALKQETDAVLKEISFPIRWTPINLREQFNCPAQPETDLNNWNNFYQDCLPKGQVKAGEFNLITLGRVASTRLIDTGRMFLGWVLSGIAIAMGAPFWFDILSKVMNVRNTGSKPSSVANQPAQKTPNVS